jgi:DNA-binding response OmpR family regulator
MKAIEQVIGDDTVLRKPFQLSELAACVERALMKLGSGWPAARPMTGT